jgi:hypothetical protein
MDCYVEWLITYNLSCGIGAIESPIIIYEDNDACVGLIKGLDSHALSQFYSVVL